MPKVTVSWSNVFKPTPQRVESLLVSMRRVIAGVAATSIAIEVPWYYPFSLVIAGLILEEAAKFIASAEEQISIDIDEEPKP